MKIDPISIVFLALAAFCGLTSGYFVFYEIEMANLKLAREEQIEYAWMYPGKMQRIKSTYKQLYPDGTAERWRTIFQRAFFVFLALTFLSQISHR